METPDHDRKEVKLMLFYDFEVFKYDWLVVIIDMDEQKEYVFINDEAGLKAFYELHMKDIWTGFNSTHYDQYILKGILCGFNPKEINDYIIQDVPGWKFSNLFKKIYLISYDVMLRTDRGLKTFEGFLGNNIKETEVPFDIDRKLTKAEIEQTVFYCRHDVEQTIEVFIRRIDEFNASMYFIKHFKYPITDLSLTKAQLASKMLGGNRKGQHFHDDFDFPILPCIQLKKYKHIAEWYMKPENKNYSKKQAEVLISGIPHTFSWGGGHGAKPKYHDIGVFMMADVTAYYPSLQDAFHIGYRVMDNPENFEFIHHSNIAFKRAGDKKKRQPFKIFDNAISGQMKQKSSALYDPMSNNAICINGQMMLLDLVEHLEPYVDLIQNNTDGILFKVRDYDRDFDLIDDIVYEWEQRTGMKMDFDTFFGEIFQKDVNNYFIIDRETGAKKIKGAYLKKLSELDYDLPIVNTALNAYMEHGIPFEQTILTCDDFKEFQQVKKISSKYEFIVHGATFHQEYQKRDGNVGKKNVKVWDGSGIIIKEKCVRVFASIDDTKGTLHKKSVKTGKLEKIENCPEHAFIYNDSVNGVKCPKELDKQWYVQMAKDRLKAFGV